MNTKTAVSHKPLLKVVRGPVFSRSNVCHVTFDVSSALANPAILGQQAPEVLVGQWCGAIEDFFRQRHTPERVHVLSQHIADESSDLRWYISCVGVLPHLMPQLGRFLDQQLLQPMKGKSPRDLIAPGPTHFEADFGKALNQARGRVGFSHSEVMLGGVQPSERVKAGTLSLAV